jgi:hypothetical protein
MSDTTPTSFFGDLAKGAALGAALGPVGAGAGAAVALVGDIADATGLTKFLFGPKAAATTAAVAAAVQAVTGTSDAAQQAAALARDPAATAQLRQALATIAAQCQAEHDASVLAMMQAQAADTANARQQTVTLAASKSVLAWGAPVISIFVLAAYALVSAFTVWLVVQHSPLPDGTVAILSTVLGASVSMATAVVGYWVGSSAGSARKDETISNVAMSP